MADVMNYLIGVLELFPTNAILTGLIIYLVWFNKHYDKNHKALEVDVAENKKCVEESKKVDNEMLLLVLKGLITNDNLPNFVRMDFYKTYKGYNGNSWVDAYVKENILYGNKHYGRRYDDKDEYPFNPNQENGAIHYVKDRSEDKNEDETT